MDSMERHKDLKTVIVFFAVVNAYQVPRGIDLRSSQRPELTRLR